ncbi:NPCBM/NEW2 domain-containing protein [Streptomyces sp. NPDC056039]|uniref:NPCBM/NEW2 domain-containing protein n=1 Tax=Streptomyces sp. NPDC056039 TaxID=3345687 RepID=UPI0035DC84C2
MSLSLPAAPSASASASASEASPASHAQGVSPGQDGLAQTPPMGFNNWNATHCGPEFNEQLIKNTADLFVSKGLKDAGYEYINLDDCWAQPRRDRNGKLVPVPERFPNGMKALAEYVHSKGLKIGIYTSAGTKTCDRPRGFPGALGHEKSDAMQFAEWGIDYLKYDNCNNNGIDAEKRYQDMGNALKEASEATGHPIVYSVCEWGENKPWEWANGVGGHLWRTTYDILDNWDAMLRNAKQTLPLARYAGPGRWNDPDMLEVGNGGMTDTEYRTHFSLWSIMAAPLLIGTDLRKATPATYEILGNREVIAVDQDPLGVQGSVVSSEDGRWVISKEMQDGSRTVALFNESDRPQRISTSAAEVGLGQAQGYTLRDLWKHRTYQSGGTVSATVPAHGTVLYRVSADRNWKSYPPAADLVLDGTTIAEPGAPARLSSVFTNLGRGQARSVLVDVDAPEGWRVTPTSKPYGKRVQPGRSLTTGWQLTPPVDAKPGVYTVNVRADYYAPKRVKGIQDSSLEIHVAKAPPTGNSHASDLDWVSAQNGFGPAEKDKSNGNQPPGDGRTLTIGGVTYAKGIGVHAASAVTYYTGGRCSAFTAQVGLDDETGQAGSVTFEIWADGRKVASTGAVSATDPARTLSAAIDGAHSVRLVVTDAGDGIRFDHADWGNAVFHC